MDTVNLSHGVETEELPSPNTTERTPEAAEPESAARPSAFADNSNPEVKRVLREKAELQDLLQRRQAEFENYRRRVERERSDLLEFAAMDSTKALLPMLDDFERALKSESTDKEYARGMELIYGRLYESLKKLGLQPITTTSEDRFDPHIHHAVEMVDSDTRPDQSILEEYQRGYYFKGRLLRPAMVKVAVKS